MKDLTRTGKKINSLIGKAIAEHGLIKDNDRILVAVSGGKDSLTLLTLLKKIQGWAPVRFELVAIHIKTDFKCGGCVHEERLTDFFSRIDVEYIFSDIKVLDEKGHTSCFWCSWNRRKAFFETAEKLGCNKIALGHHKDDIVETLLLNMIYNSEISAMNPYQEMFGGKLAIIRPLCYVEESLIKQFAGESGFPEQLCQCPFGGSSRRKYIKEFIRQTARLTPKVNIKSNIFNSVKRVRLDYIDVGGE